MAKELKDELQVEDSPQTAVVTQYTVQVRVDAYLAEEADEDEKGPVSVWLELGQYEAPSGARRKAIELAMAEHGLEEGSFHTIPESSAGVETCRVKKSFSWD